MPNDIFYGADCEARIGRRADRDTAPASWQAIEFMQLTITPNQERRERSKMGVPGQRQNALDPTRPRPGFFRLAASLVLDLDSRQLPIWLRYGMGAPAAAVANGDLYDHVWSSGSKTEAYFDLQLKVGANDVRIYEGLTIGALSLQASGENTQDFDLNLALQGLRRRRATAFEGGAPTACPAEAPILRALYKVDDVAADNMLSANFSYDRQLQEGIYLSATPTVFSLRPNGGAHAMTATFRAIGAVFDDIEEESEPFASALDFIGVVEDHRILLEQPSSLLTPGPMPVTGGGMIERTFNSAGHQTPTTPATRITVTNDVESYA